MKIYIHSLIWQSFIENQFKQGTGTIWLLLHILFLLHSKILHLQIISNIFSIHSSVLWEHWDVKLLIQTIYIVSSVLHVCIWRLHKWLCLFDISSFAKELLDCLLLTFDSGEKVVSNGIYSRITGQSGRCLFGKVSSKAFRFSEEEADAWVWDFLW